MRAYGGPSTEVPINSHAEIARRAATPKNNDIAARPDGEYIFQLSSALKYEEKDWNWGCAAFLASTHSASLDGHRHCLPGLKVPRIHHYRLTNIDARSYLDPVCAAPAGHHNFFDGLAAFNGNHFFDAGESYDCAGRNCRRAAGLIRNNLGPHKCAGSQAAANCALRLRGRTLSC